MFSLEYNDSNYLKRPSTFEISHSANNDSTLCPKKSRAACSDSSEASDATELQFGKVHFKNYVNDCKAIKHVL